MRILLIGGTGLISTAITRELLDRGEEVWLYNRGQTHIYSSPPGAAHVLLGDRQNHSAFEHQMADAEPFDCVIDMIGYLPEDAHSVVRAFRGRTRQYIFCSTIDVYRKPATRYPLWTEALDHPGGAQCGLGAQLLRSIEWWRLRPAPERVQMDPPPGDLHRRPVCAVADEHTWLVYAPEGTGPLTLKGIRPSDWDARWFNPRTGERQAVGPVEVGITYRWQAPPCPSRDDWVLLLRRPGLSSA